MENILAERRSKAEQTFDELQKQKEQKQEEIDQLDQEMFRLQGEWRLLNELDTKKSGKKGKDVVSPQAEVIDVESVINNEEEKK